MIVAVCLNPAVDVTYEVERLSPGHVHRVGRAYRSAGGKGSNVARVLARLGAPVRLLGLAGGAAGAELAAALTADGVDHVLVPVAGETRHTVTIVDAQGATGLNEPGPVIAADDWPALVAAFTDQLDTAEIVVLSGSVPAGAPEDAYAQLVERARRRGIATLLDADGAALSTALPARPTLAKPNATEAGELLGRCVGSEAAALAACRHVMAAGAQAAVISRGADGLAAVLHDRSWTARLGEPIAGNPTGAGDALTAGLARGLVAGADPVDVLADATALAAAAVAAPVAGTVDIELAATLRSDVVVAEY